MRLKIEETINKNYDSIYMYFLTPILDHKWMYNMLDNGGLTFGFYNQRTPFN